MDEEEYKDEKEKAMVEERLNEKYNMVYKRSMDLELLCAWLIGFFVIFFPLLVAHYPQTLTGFVGGLIHGIFGLIIAITLIKPKRRRK